MQIPLNEKELNLLYKIEDDFWVQLGKLVSKSISKAPEHLEPYLLMMLQDKCSVYGTDYKRMETPLKETLIDNLKLSIRSKNILRNNNIINLNDLLNQTYMTLLRMPNLGRKTLKNIIICLKEYDLKIEPGSPYIEKCLKEFKEFENVF